MTAFTRTLHFSSNGLGKEATFLFTFDDLETNPQLYKDQFPVCWKVSTFGASGPYNVQMTYKSQLSFTRPQVDSGLIIGAATYVDINTGQTTNLTQDGNGVPSFSAPVPDSSLSGGLLQAWNKSGQLQDVTVAFHNNPNADPTPALYFPAVGDQSNVTAQFTPVLRLYAYSNYQETQIIKGAIQSSVLWSQNLAQLDNQTTNYVITRDAAGHYIVTQE